VVPPLVAGCSRVHSIKHTGVLIALLFLPRLTLLGVSLILSNSNSRRRKHSKLPSNTEAASVVLQEEGVEGVEAQLEEQAAALPTCLALWGKTPKLTAHSLRRTTILEGEGSQTKPQPGILTAKACRRLALRRLTGLPISRDCPSIHDRLR